MTSLEAFPFAKLQGPCSTMLMEAAESVFWTRT